MKGGVYSDQKCPECGGSFKHFEPHGLWCPDHPQCRPTRLKVKFGKLCKRFKSYERAYRLLTGVRYETDQGKFDIRDYQRDNPLGFETLVEKYLEKKKRLKAIRDYRCRLNFGVAAWHNRNVKEINYADIEDLLLKLQDDGRSDKYIYDILCCLKGFWNWLLKRREITWDQMPEFPEWEYQMALRKTVTKETQNRILDEVHRLTWKLNPRIYIGILFLATYINTRPHEMRNIKEKHIDLENGRILIPRPKEKHDKYIYLIPDDIELLRSIPRGFPDLYFFRHVKSYSGVRKGQRFGRDLMSNWWRMACDNLEISGVPLYPGTRHSTAIDQRKRHSTEDVKRSMGTRSNKAFERYLQVTGDELVNMYQDSRTGKGTGTIIYYPQDKNRENEGSSD